MLFLLSVSLDQNPSELLMAELFDLFNVRPCCMLQEILEILITRRILLVWLNKG